MLSSQAWSYLAPAGQAGQDVAGSPGFRDSLAFSLACLWGGLSGQQRGDIFMGCGHSVSLWLMAPVSHLLLAVWFPFRVSPIPFPGKVVTGRWPHLGLSEFGAFPSLIPFPYRLF